MAQKTLVALIKALQFLYRLISPIVVYIAIQLMWVAVFILRTMWDYVWWNARAAWDVEFTWTKPYRPWFIRDKQPPPIPHDGVYTFRKREWRAVVPRSNTGS